MTMMIKKTIKKFGQTEKDSISFAPPTDECAGRARDTRARTRRANELEPAVEERKSNDDLCADDDGARARRKLARARARDVGNDASKDDDVDAADDDDDDATRGARARGRCG